MLKCANCTTAALYTLNVKGASPVDYCPKCLPVHLRGAATSGTMPLRKVTLVPQIPNGPLVKAVEPDVITKPKPTRRKRATVAKAVSVNPVPEAVLADAIADGYSPDAADSDGDGLVQDETAFERKLDEVLVDYSEE